MVSECLPDEMPFKKVAEKKWGSKSKEAKGNISLTSLREFRKYSTVDWERYRAVESEIMWCFVDTYKSFGFYSEWDRNQLEKS